MADPKVPVVCRSCGNKVTLDQVKFDDVRKAYVCNPCFKASHNSPSKEVSSDKSISKSATFSDRIDYICTSCKYKFSAKKDKKPHECPYCAHKILEVRDDSADRLIGESEGYV